MLSAACAETSESGRTCEDQACGDASTAWRRRDEFRAVGCGFDGFEQVRVLTFLLMMRVIRVVRVVAAMRRHFSQFNARRRRVRRRRLCSAGVLSLETAAALWILSA